MTRVALTAILASAALVLAFADQPSAKQPRHRAAKSVPPAVASEPASLSKPGEKTQPAEQAGNAQSADKDAKAGEGSEPAAATPPTWSDEEIRNAKAHCDKVLRGVEAVIEAADPIKEGECGAPAPVRLISIGRSPEVTLSPPVTVTCDMVATLARWIKDDLQPLAKEHLGGPVIKIGTMSSYSCRNAYGRKTTRLSEHALANAVDVGGFTTQSGLEVDLVTGWGLTARDVEAIVARAKAAEKAAAKSASAQSKSPEKTESKAAADNRRAGRNIGLATASTIPLPVRKPDESVRNWTVQLKAGGRKVAIKEGSKPSEKAGVLLAANHLGGPEKMLADEAGAIPHPDDRMARFLRAAHQAACRHFGTVLGPEANEAHRNHFHLDMAKRKHSNYCE